MKRKELLSLLHMLKEKREKLMEENMEFSASILEQEIGKIEYMVKQIDEGEPDEGGP